MGVRTVPVPHRVVVKMRQCKLKPLAKSLTHGQHSVNESYYHHLMKENYYFYHLNWFFKTITCWTSPTTKAQGQMLENRKLIWAEVPNLGGEIRRVYAHTHMTKNTVQGWSVIMWHTTQTRAKMRDRPKRGALQWPSLWLTLSQTHFRESIYYCLYILWHIHLWN